LDWIGLDWIGLDWIGLTDCYVVAGALVGYALAVLVAFIAIPSGEDEWIFYAIAAVLMLLGGCCTLCIGKWMVIVFTSLCGAAFMYRGFVGILNIYFPSKFDSTQYTILWVALLLLLAVVGIVVQFQWTASMQLRILGRAGERLQYQHQHQLPTSKHEQYIQVIDAV
jgi:ABC-type multidrug transport system fused ATPase/permease subunit